MQHLLNIITDAMKENANNTDALYYINNVREHARAVKVFKILASN